jgi:hypothetical protein
MIEGQELIWRVHNNSEVREWLLDTYGPPNDYFPTDRTGWASSVGYIFMTEPMYLLYTLKFND